MHLKYNINRSTRSGVDVHPITDMRELGLNYSHASEPCIIMDWIFWNVEVEQEVLPDYISEYEGCPLDVIGICMPREKANKIKEIEENIIAKLQGNDSREG